MRRSSTCCGILLLAAFGLFAGDVSETQRRLFEAQEAERQRDLENQVTARYVPGAVVTEACENGDFEAGLEGWSGAYGAVPWGTDEPDLDTLTQGILQGKLTLSSSRQTVVSIGDGPDPNVGISQVAPGGSTRAVRIGNSREGGGVELLERTFVVSRSRPSIGFRYAVVLEAPLHETAHLPLFRVRVTDAKGMEIPDVVHLNTGVDGIAERLTAEDGPPFTTVVRKSSSVPIVFVPWTCAFIDLACYAGQTVTVQFIVEDCPEFGHWGYAYIDDFCNANCPGGEVQPTCGSGSNLVRNGDFEAGDSEIGSELTYQPAPGAPGSVLPGEYSIVNCAQAGTISPTWLDGHESCNTTGKFLVVNGATGRTGSRRIWSQTISVAPGKAYRFCAHFRNLPQCVLDVQPKVELRFSSPTDVATPIVNACTWKRQSRRIVIPPGVVSLTVEIWLDESGEGDGNDLAIDDLSLRVDAEEVTP